METQLVPSRKSKPKKFFETLSDVECRLSDSKPLLYKVYTHIGTIKKMYIYSSDSCSVTGLTYSDISNIESFPKKHSKAKRPNPIKKVWQMQQISPRKLEFIQACKSPIDLNSTFIKYGWDLKIKSQVNKSVDMLFPIYKIFKLEFSDQKNSNLIFLLENLKISNQESEKNSITMNLIDSNLQTKSNINKNNEKSNKGNFLGATFEILLKPDDEFKVLGAINLGKTGKEDMNELIYEVFGKMLPGFRLLGIFDEEHEEIVQVVVRARKIVIPPKTRFRGEWYLERKNEIILASGVYFCKVDKSDGNCVEFRLERLIHEYYTAYLEYYCDVKVPFDEKTGILFLNSLPNWFSDINNSSEEVLERVYLEFCIVDTKKRLETNQIRRYAFNVLKLKSNLPKVLIDEILSYVFCFDSLFK